MCIVFFLVKIDGEFKFVVGCIVIFFSLKKIIIGFCKVNVFGVKKVVIKFGVKKLGGDVVIDFDEVEKKVKEEVECIEKLGYDFEVEE